jgi:hypothetical protein
VTARVGRFELWFETRDAELSPSLEALAGLLLLPSLRSRRRLVLRGRPDALWLANAERLAAVLARWWGWEERPRFGFRRGEPDAAPAAGRARGTAAFFSGGVDSFHTLLFSGRAVGALVAVAGFDVPLRDAERLAWLEGALREVARERGVEALWIRTNLREIPFLERANWSRTHGAALAAIGHHQRQRFERVLIPSTVPRKRSQPWGSSWEIDALWSSRWLEVASDGCERDRSEKVAVLAGNPLVERHLRVCFANRPGTLNCSRCEKCLRTLLDWTVCGRPPPATFERGVPLAERLAEIPHALPNSVALYRDLLPRLAGQPELARAVEGLIARSLARAARAAPATAGSPARDARRAPWRGASP